METTNEQIKNTVLEAIFLSDQYVSTREISLQTGITEGDLIEAVNSIKKYNELFLDIYKHESKQNFLNVRVPEFIRDEVRGFLDDGGFISLEQNTPTKDVVELVQPNVQNTSTEEKQSKGKSAKDFLKAAGLIALITLTLKKSFTFFRK